MGNNNYARGAAFERKVKERLESMDFYAIRAAGSHGQTDVVGFPPEYARERALFIQCKTGKATMTKAARLELFEVAFKYDALPILATPKGGDVNWEQILPDGSLTEWRFF